MKVMNGIKASTSGGDIVLRQISGFIEASTSGGDVEAEMALTDFSKDHHVFFNRSCHIVISRRSWDIGKDRNASEKRI